MGTKHSKSKHSAPPSVALPSSLTFVETTDEYWLYGKAHRSALLEWLSKSELEISDEVIAIIGRFVRDVAWCHANYVRYIHAAHDSARIDKLYSDWLRALQQSKQEKEEASNLRVVIEGAIGVGKNRLLQRLQTGRYSEEEVLFEPTIEEYITLQSRIVANNAEYIIRLDVSRLVPDEEFMYTRHLSYPPANILLVVFDVSENSSFVKCAHFVENIQSEKKRAEAAPYVIMLVANKCDRRMSEFENENDDLDDNEQVVNMDQVETYITKNQIAYIEVSNKSGQNVAALLQQCVFEYYLATQ